MDIQWPNVGCLNDFGRTIKCWNITTAANALRLTEVWAATLQLERAWQNDMLNPGEDGQDINRIRQNLAEVIDTLENAEKAWKWTSVMTTRGLGFNALCESRANPPQGQAKVKRAVVPHAAVKLYWYNYLSLMELVAQTILDIMRIKLALEVVNISGPHIAPTIAPSLHIFTVTDHIHHIYRLDILVVYPYIFPHDQFGQVHYIIVIQDNMIIPVRYNISLCFRTLVSMTRLVLLEIDA